MKKNRLASMLATSCLTGFIALSLLSCKTLVHTGPQRDLMRSLQQTVDRMWSQGELPGIHPDDHGKAKISQAVRGQVTYPTIETIKVKRDQDPENVLLIFTYFRADAESEWELKHAYRQSADGALTPLSMDRKPGKRSQAAKN